MATSGPKLELVETAKDRITILADFPYLSPAQRFFDYWTRTDLLKKWWPPEAELRPKVGGAFTWKWDHEFFGLGSKCKPKPFQKLVLQHRV